MVFKKCYSFLVLTLLASLSCQAQGLETPKGPVLLTLSGAIDIGNSANTDGTKSARFDLAMLEKIGLKKITTETPWTKGLKDFEGVLARDLLTHVKYQGTSVRASALDNYTVDIPIDDFMAHDVIIATRIDGKVLRIRDNGPLWVIYPWTSNSDLKRPHYFSRSIWQLHSLTVNK